MVEIREATEADRDSAVRLMWKAFDASENLDNIRKQDWINLWNKSEEEDWAFVAVDGKKVVSNFCFFASDKNIIRGKPIRFAGVWAVATEPSYRHQGLIRGLFEKTFPLMKERGCVLSILDPFSRPFYENFGYALAEKRSKHILKYDYLKKVEPPQDLTIREIMDTSDVNKILEVEQSMARFGSRFFHTERSITEMINEGHFHILEKGNEPVGTTKFWFAKGEHGYKLTAGVIRYKYDYVLPSIIQLIQNHSVNCEKLTCWTDIEVPIQHFVKKIHPAESHVIGSMMMRVIDFPGFCESISIDRATTEEVVISLNDKHCKWNTGVYRLIPNDGNLVAERSDKSPEVEINEFQLSQIVAGRTPITQLRGFGEIECSVKTACNLEAIFKPDSFVSYQRF
jgi:predicted acetyltransferase